MLWLGRNEWLLCGRLRSRLGLWIWFEFLIGWFDSPCDASLAFFEILFHAGAVEERGVDGVLGWVRVVGLDARDV